MIALVHHLADYGGMRFEMGYSSAIMLFLLLTPIFIIAHVFILKSSNKRLGLILPFAWFASTVVFMLAGLISTHIYDNEILTYVLLFIALNIPTDIMLLMMYIKSGKDKQKKNEVDISKIKDLD